MNLEAKQLQIFLEREGLSQEQLAAELKIDQPQVSRMLRGKLNISLKHIKTLHLKYDLNYQWVLHNTGTMKVKQAGKRNIMTDLTDIHAALGLLMAGQDNMRDTVFKILADNQKLQQEINQLKIKIR